MVMKNVVSLNVQHPSNSEDEAEEPKGSLAIPASLNVRQKNAWNDLVRMAKVEDQVPENHFAFEMAAVLLAKFRAGKTMTATESKELKRLLIQLGVAKDNEAKGNGGKKSKYFD